jgi:2-polyprenyl-6-methoxyphenol hydroxylase-like FAD-dependent oxidoreductase
VETAKLLEIKLPIALNNKRVLISGASVAGPSFALWLKRFGFEPTIVERAPTIRPGGYAVDFRGTSLRILKKMELFEEAKKYEIRTSTVTIVDADNKKITNMPDGFTSGEFEIQRGDLANILYTATKNDTEYIFGNSIAGIDEVGDGVEVKFLHGEERRFDLIVGADGLHSNVRALTFGEESNFLRHLGYYISIFTIPNIMDLGTESLYYGTLGKRAALYGTGKTNECKVGLLFASPPLDIDRQHPDHQKDIIRKIYAHEKWKVPEILHHLTASPDFYFDSISQIKMNSFSSGRTTLLGDAAWCASPVSGMGTSLAIVGAYILAGELKDANGDYAVAFPRYENQMRDFVHRCQKLADGVKWFCPTTKFQDRLSTLMLKLLPYTPWKNMMMEYPVKVGNSISPKDYFLPADKNL